MKRTTTALCRDVCVHSVKLFFGDIFFFSPSLPFGAFPWLDYLLFQRLPSTRFRLFVVTCFLFSCCFFFPPPSFSCACVCVKTPSVGCFVQCFSSPFLRAKVIAKQQKSVATEGQQSVGQLRRLFCVVTQRVSGIGRLAFSVFFLVTTVWCGFSERNKEKKSTPPPQHRKYEDVHEECSRGLRCQRCHGDCV